jgi:hypothetical protein
MTLVGGANPGAVGCVCWAHQATSGAARPLSALASRQVVSLAWAQASHGHEIDEGVRKARQVALDQGALMRGNLSRRARLL